MIWKILLVVLLVLIIIYIAYLIITYNKMEDLDKEVNIMWNDFIDLLNKRMDTLNKYIKDNKIKNKDIVNAVKNFDVNTNPTDLVNAYYKLNSILTDDMLETVKMNTNKIAKFRLEYNDKALKLNNYIDFIPSTFTAHFHKFKKRIYFRDK
jgi:hypothetical protein